MKSDPFARVDTKTAKGLVNVVIDTPSGSTTKFKYDESNRCYRVSRILPVGAFFPYNFGSIPRTLAADGDPLDILVLAPGPLFVGCLVEVKLVGILLASQRESGKTIKNDRLLGVPVTEVNPPSIEHIDQIEKTRLAEIEHFFISYNAAQGRAFAPAGRGGPPEAESALRAAQQRYARRHKQ
jgi:inorganic pyrophosphatase